ncbi:hypothetical protein [Streptomyces ardesiacus]|uniref:hypothetical protein n=1 Tax=Streptomyces ardesiacus TaxID=285564 RepID=UPI003660B027
MSAREEVHSYLVAALNQETLYAHEAEYSAEKLINDLLHEEAEKLRAEKIQPPLEADGRLVNSVIETMAQKIDPYSS